MPKRKRNAQSLLAVAAAAAGAEAGARRKVIARRRAGASGSAQEDQNQAAAASTPGGIIAGIASAASNWVHLESWLKQAGARFDGLEVRPAGPSMGLGAFAKRDLNAGEAVLAVPTNLLLTEKSAASEDSVVAAVAEHLRKFGEAAMPELLLSLRLCRAKVNSADRFHIYAASLPESAPGAAAWEPAYREVLMGTTLGPSLVAADQELDKWQRLLQRMAEDPASGLREPLQEISRPLLLWARGMVQSRQFPAGCMAGSMATSSELCMVPLLDLLNHKADVEISVQISRSSGMVEFVCGSPVKAGMQVWNNYGSKCNSEMLMCYGFAIENNKKDVLPLEWALPAGSEATSASKLSEKQQNKVIRLTMAGIPEDVVDDIEARQDTAQFVGLLKSLLALRRNTKQVLAKVPEKLNFNVCKGPLARARKASIQEFLESQLRIVEVCLEEMQTAEPDAPLGEDGENAAMGGTEEQEANESDLELEDEEEELLLRRRKRRRHR